VAAASNDLALSFIDEIAEHDAAVVAHQGSQWNGKPQIIAGAAVPELSLAMLATVRLQVRPPVVSQQCSDAGVGAQDDISALATVATVGSAPRLALAFLERGNTGATVAAASMQGYLVDERRHGLSS
jgi:hypothetical protein